MLCRQSPQRRRRICTLCEAKIIRVENVLSPSTCSTRASPATWAVAKGGFRVWKLPTPHLHWCWLSIPVEAGTEPSWLADVSMSVNSTSQVSLQASLPCHPFELLYVPTAVGRQLAVLCRWRTRTKTCSPSNSPNRPTIQPFNASTRSTFFAPARWSPKCLRKPRPTDITLRGAGAHACRGFRLAGKLRLQRASRSFGPLAAPTARRFDGFGGLMPVEHREVETLTFICF